VIGYEVQGRRTDRETGRRSVRNHVRLASAGDRDAAFAIANAMAAEHFTVWIFRTDRQFGKKSYQLLGVVPNEGAS
jgi:hypothetical protein